jgi:hypothetical protein
MEVEISRKGGRKILFQKICEFLNIFRHKRETLELRVFGLNL